MKNVFMAICVLILIAQSRAQEFIQITFRHYPTKPDVVRAFVPGAFNNWGPNSSGVIAPTAPSLMTYIDSLQCWVKSYRLPVGETQLYKFHEHFNESGTSNQWLSDPLNPMIESGGYFNSILEVTEIMIFEILPKNGSVLSEKNPDLIAGIFVAENDTLLLSQSTISLNGEIIATMENYYIADLSLLKFTLPELANGSHTVALNIGTKNGGVYADSVTFAYQGASPELKPLPAGVGDGINYVDNSTVTLVLHAPYTKKFAYVIGDFNNWLADPAHFMYQTPDRQRYWLTLTDLDPDKEYAFQYLVDGETRIADPYSEKVLDPSYDSYITDATYPGLMAYPYGKTTEIASVFQINQDEYQWQTDDFDRPEISGLVIYEMLIRDFLAEHDYKTLIDSLDYFQRLGVSAIELMPVAEFEGNESWGYNTSLNFATDKYYGPKNELKRFVDACHQRGIAVILDIVLNHSFGQAPLVRLFSEGNNGPPSSDNIWYNADYDLNYGGYQARHPYNVGYDFNHESYSTKQYVDRVNRYWLEEFRIDGFRFDLTKGFTQRVSYIGNGSYNESLASQYDASRIAILKRMADQIWAVDSTAYVILEHFAENSEEKELAGYGMMLWGNSNHNYNEATMGYHDSGKSDFSWGFYDTRDWSAPHLVTYMESHDEERLMYKNLEYGNSSGSYSIKELPTALNRMKLAGAFFFTLPGPKMIWQFGELGYDFSIEYNGRLGNKPIRWDYYQDSDRQNLYKTFAALIHLRKENEAFTSPESQVALAVGGSIKRINITHQTMSVSIIGNFGVTAAAANPQFQRTGVWYDYFYGDSLTVSNISDPISLNPGEFHIYTDRRLASPGSGIIDRVADVSETTPGGIHLFQNYPNPFNASTVIRYSVDQTEPVHTVIKIFNTRGQLIKTLVDCKQSAGVYEVRWDGTDTRQRPVASGVYLYSLNSEGRQTIRKLVCVK
ncbi:MAG: alpha-amylase family glycosyl hydrolase [Candidatus Zhuqueibacterota bacterium]